MNAILAGLIGALAGGLISWLTTNARLRRELELLYDRELRDNRNVAYTALWNLTEPLPRAWIKGRVTGENLKTVRESWHNWYYTGGGIYMSQTVRDRYFCATPVLEKFADAAQGRELTDLEYQTVYESVKALRDSLTDDIGARLDPQLARKWGLKRTKASTGEIVREKEDDSDRRLPAENPMFNVERAQYLWEEFQYRHDLIWKLLFRITFVAVLLTITPFTINKSIRDRVDGWLILLPILAILLAAGSWRLLATEFRLFAPIDELYRWYREQALEEALPCRQVDELRKLRQKKFDFFKLIVFVYPPLLIVLIGLAFAAFMVTG
jgi:hypothetical protein